MSLRFHEIAEASHRILNPFSTEKLLLVGDICAPAPGARLLDLACGKGELLAQWARRYEIIGVGVDISEVFVQAARERADELEVLDRLHFVIEDAAEYPQPFHTFDIVTCLGATWIGGGLAGTLDLMRTALKPRDGLLVVGEPFWYQPPTPEVLDAMQTAPDTFTTLGGTLDRFEAAGLELVEMVMANLDDWDRYVAAQWLAVDHYLRDNPDDPEAAALRTWIRQARQQYLHYGRQWMGWGVFVLRVMPSAQG